MNAQTSCSVCKRAEATFYRRTSGHYLCIKCFIRASQRAVKRFLSRTRCLKPRSRVLVAYSLLRPDLYLLTLLIISNIEAEYNSNIIAVAPGDGVSVVEKLITDHRLENVEVVPSDELRQLAERGYLNFIEIIKAELKVAMQIAESKGVKAVIRPYDRLMLNALFLYGVLRGSICDSLEGMDHKVINETHVLAPLGSLAPDEIAYLAYVYGIHEYVSKLNHVLRGVREDAMMCEVRKLLLRMYDDSPELIFSMRSSIEETNVQAKRMNLCNESGN